MATGRVKQSRPLSRGAGKTASARAIPACGKMKTYKRSASARAIPACWELKKKAPHGRGGTASLVLFPVLENKGGMRGLSSYRVLIIWLTALGKSRHPRVFNRRPLARTAIFGG
jgi:hypothetical protein